MKLDKNGAVISTITAAQMSTIGSEYVCMWDEEGLPIHIHTGVIDYLHNGIHPHPNPTQSPFIDDEK